MLKSITRLSNLNIKMLARRIGSIKNEDKLIPARFAFRKNSDLLSDIYWIGSVPAGLIGCGIGVLKGLNDLKGSSRDYRIMHGSMMGVVGFGVGFAAWMLWPLTVSVGLTTYIYDYLEAKKIDNSNYK